MNSQITTSQNDVSGSGGRAGRENGEESQKRRTGRFRLWTVACVIAAVVLGPGAVTASALDEANTAPVRNAVRADHTQAYIPTDTSRRGKWEG